MKTTFTNLVLLMMVMLIPMGAMQAQHLKIATDGVVIPKADHNAIVNEENGQMVYDTVTKSIWYYNNSIWKEVGSDNLGNHIATETLNMANELIKNLATPMETPCTFLLAIGSSCLASVTAIILKILMIMCIPR